MKKNRIVYFLILILSVLLYVFTEVDFAAFLVAVLIVYIVIAAATVYLTGNELKIRFSGDTEGPCGAGIKPELIVENKSIMPVFSCTATLKSCNMISGQEEKLKKVFSLLPKQEKRYSFYMESQYCGCIETELLEIYKADPLKIFYQQVKPFKNHVNVHYALPVIGDTGMKKSDLERYDMESYKYSQSQKGNDPSETFGIKNYEPGDNIKAIHWKLSGKIGDMVIREFGHPIENKLMVLCDKRIMENSDLSPERRSQITEISLSVMYSLAKIGVNHSAGWFDYYRNEFECRQITSTDDVYEIMPLLLRGSFKEDKMSTVDHFIEADVEQSYASYIFITASETEDPGIERLRNYGEVSIYRPENFK